MTFQEALLRRGIPFRVSGTPAHKCSICCPFCIQRGKERDTRFRLCVHVTQLWGRCLHCDWRHRYAIAPVLKQLGIIATVTGAEPIAETQAEPVTLPKDFLPLTRVYDDLDVQAQNYILKRGITPEQIRTCKIGVSYCGKYAYRILFPIYVGNELRGINARDFTGHGTPKYLLNRGEKFLFHFDPKQETVILSEGVIKALRIEQAQSYAGSAALLGHDLTAQQFEQIQGSRCRHIILYPDTDLVGMRGVINIANYLKENWTGAVSIAWPVAAPADELPMADLKALLASSVTPYTPTLRRKILLKK